MHELYLRIFEKLNEFKALGLPLPDDLVRVEKELEAYFKAQQRAAKKTLEPPPAIGSACSPISS